jgi:hypothetical protein
VSFFFIFFHFFWTSVGPLFFFFFFGIMGAVRLRALVPVSFFLNLRHKTFFFLTCSYKRGEEDLN